MVEGYKVDIGAFKNRHGELKFPCFVLKECFPTVPLLVEDLPKGDVPVVAEFKGVERIICRVDNNARTALKILRANGPFEYRESREKKYDINKIEDYLEVFTWT